MKRQKSNTAEVSSGPQPSGTRVGVASLPRQERSRRTLARLEKAAESMLNSGTFDDATVPEIVRRAGSSVGSFYARFPTKQTLLDHLIDKIHDEMLDTAIKHVREARWAGAGLGQRAHAHIELVVNWTRRRHGILRARLIDHLHKRKTLSATRIRKNRRLVRYIREFFEPCLGEIASPNPRRSLEFALQVVDALVAAHIMLAVDGQSAFRTLKDRDFIQDLTRLFLLYLGQSSG